MFKRTSCLVMLTLLSFSIQTAADTVAADEAHQFINQYKDIAIREMHRTGIPASVTLAQAIHESSWGKGVLALNSNNHFGIKCKADWTGATYYKEDDDYVNGELVKSCFRNYPSVDASYVDHSNFLKENMRYEMLFQLDEKDYIGWSRGLKSCGYATDPRYAEKLIRTIEDYQLYKFDFVEKEEQVLVTQESVPSSVPSVSSMDELVLVSSSPAAPQEQYHWEAEEMEVPAAYQIPEGYVRNSHYKKSRPIQRAELTVAPQAPVEEPGQAATFETPQYNNMAMETSTAVEEEWNEQEETYETRTVVQQNRSVHTPSTYYNTHTPIRYNGVKSTTHEQPKRVANSVIKNRRLPRVRVNQSRK